jgi:glycosyltransferase involved in cell wall biosynthesis
MRIALVTSYYEEKGYGGNEYYMAKHLTKRGHEVFIYVSEWSIPRYGNIRKINQPCSLKGVTLRRLPSITIGRKKQGMVFIKGLRKQIKKDKIDLVHVQEWFLPGVYPCLGFHPLVLTQRVADYPWQLKLFSFFMSPFILRRADLLTSLTTTGAKEMKKYCSIGKKKPLVISNGVNVDLFKPSKHAIKREGKETIFVYVGRIDSEKGVDIIIQACKKLKFDYKCYIIGLGVWKKKMEALTRKLGLTDKIKFLGKIEHIDLPNYYSSADCVLVPSKIEPFGFVTLEGLACGRPVIGSNIGGMKDVINEKVGLKVKPGDINSLAKAMAAMNNRKFTDELAKNCRKHIIDNYSWEKVIDKNPFYRKKQ